MRGTFIAGTRTGRRSGSVRPAQDAVSLTFLEAGRLRGKLLSDGEPAENAGCDPGESGAGEGGPGDGAVGREGVGLTFGEGYDRAVWVFDRDSLEYLGSDRLALLEAGVVGKVGETPAG
ncbi:hypothetical protein WB401_40540 [Streptomyces brasiliscabiei]|uniref:Uncharacterized protein n=1 Tax=Streptomyces brasiliscabiei TaxID=2736302 RepID=A0ABU8GR08_9ACTN